MTRLLQIALLLSVGLCCAQNPPPRPEFEVASIKPSQNRHGSTTFNHCIFTATHTSVLSLIRFAWQVHDYQIAGAPAWENSEYFDVSAKAPADKAKLNFGEAMPMLQALLEDRFKLAINREKKTVEGYALVVAKSGPKLQRNTDDQMAGGYGPGRLMGRHISLPEIATHLSQSLNLPVVDSTSIEGYYDVDLRWRPDDLAAPNDERPTIFAALQELGLKLQSQRLPAEIIVIDHLERTPTEN